MQHPTFSATLADQHRDELGGQADQLRLLRTSRPNSRRGGRPPATVAAERLASPPVNRPRRPPPRGKPPRTSPRRTAVGPGLLLEARRQR